MADSNVQGNGQLVATRDIRGNFRQIKQWLSVVKRSFIYPACYNSYVSFAEFGEWLL